MIHTNVIIIITINERLIANDISRYICIARHIHTHICMYIHVCVSVCAIIILEFSNIIISLF